MARGMGMVRNLIVALGAFALIVSFGTFAQQPAKVWRVGYLALIASSDQQVEAFREGLHALGYVEGRNLVIENRFADGREDRLPELAEALVRLKVDVIVTRTVIVALAARRATSSIPIVMANASDPVESGLVASLPRPGGNVTGLTQNSNELVGKRLQLLREAVPKAGRIGTLHWDKSPLKAQFFEQVRASAKQIGVTIVNEEAGTPEAIAAAFAVMKRERVQALMVPSSPFATNHWKTIIQLAAQQRLPTSFETRQPVAEGALISYGASVIEMHRQAARYVDKILKGARPADLPVEQAAKFDLVINLKTAKALGLTIPQSVLLQATEVIN